MKADITMKKVIAKIANTVRTLYLNPLVINAYVEEANDQVRSVNWGDDINYHFITYITKREVAIYYNTPIATAFKRPNYLCIGSTLNYLPTRETIVWGAGVIDDGLGMRAVPARVLAVRGPMTRAYLLSRGIACPEVYGDPALLIPYFYKPRPSGRLLGQKICFVPHYADKQSPILAAIRKNYPDLRFVDIEDYGKWTDFIDQVCECDAVFSSSLHGLIVAEAYGIPNYWISVSGNVIGNGFKFRDYFASIGKFITDPFVLDEAFDPRDTMALHPWSRGRIDLKKLLDACPFDIKLPIQHEHPLDL